MKNVKDVSKELTKREGGKVQLTIAQADQAVAHICDMIEEDWTVARILFKNGQRRAAAKLRAAKRKRVRR